METSASDGDSEAAERAEEVDSKIPDDRLVENPGEKSGHSVENDETNDSKAIRYPQALICPLSKQVFTDPVVASDGESYERSAVLKERGDDDDTIKELYPNRALKAIIEETPLLQGDTLQAGIKRLQFSLEATVSQLFDPPPHTTTDGPHSLSTTHRPLSEGYFCPITFNIVHEPVIDPEGNTYEKVAAENWIRSNGNSPVTRSRLSIDQLYSNNAIRRLLEDEKAKPENEMHPTVRNWKDETPPQATDVELGGGIAITPFSPALDQNGMVIIGGSSSTAHYIQYRHRLARRRSMFNALAVIFFVVCLTGLVILGQSFFLILFMMFLIILFSRRRPVR